MHCLEYSDLGNRCMHFKAVLFTADLHSARSFKFTSLPRSYFAMYWKSALRAICKTNWSFCKQWFLSKHCELATSYAAYYLLPNSGANEDFFVSQSFHSISLLFPVLNGLKVTVRAWYIYKHGGIVWCEDLKFISRSLRVKCGDRGKVTWIEYNYAKTASQPWRNANIFGRLLEKPSNFYRGVIARGTDVALTQSDVPNYSNFWWVRHLQVLCSRSAFCHCYVAKTAPNFSEF